MQRCVIHWLPSSELQDARSLCLKTRPNAKQISIIMQSKLFFTRKFLHVASFWNWGCLEFADMSLLPRAYIIIWHNLPEISSPIAKLFGSFGSLKSDFQWISTHKLNEVCIIQVIIQETGLYFFYSFLSFFDIELSISWQFRRGFQARYRHWIFVLNILQLLRNYTRLTF